MPRKTATVVIDATGRDQGKTFRLTEMPASQVEAWAMRAFLALAKSGADVPDALMSSGLAGLQRLGPGALSGMAYADLAPLLEEMMACVAIIPDAARPQVIRNLVEDDIEEVTTRLKLRAEVWKLHTGFSHAGSPPA